MNLDGFSTSSIFDLVALLVPLYKLDRRDPGSQASCLRLPSHRVHETLSVWPHSMCSCHLATGAWQHRGIHQAGVEQEKELLGHRSSGEGGSQEHWDVDVCQHLLGLEGRGCAVHMAFWEALKGILMSLPAWRSYPSWEILTILEELIIKSFTDLAKSLRTYYLPGSVLEAGDTSRKPHRKHPCSYGAGISRETGQTRGHAEIVTILGSEN